MVKHVAVGAAKMIKIWCPEVLKVISFFIHELERYLRFSGPARDQKLKTIVLEADPVGLFKPIIHCATQDELALAKFEL